MSAPSMSSETVYREHCPHCNTLRMCQENERGSARTTISSDRFSYTSYFSSGSYNNGPLNILMMKCQVCPQCANLYSHNITYL